MLWAVHISDGVLLEPWLVSGVALTMCLAAAGAWRLRDEEVPRIALLTAAFFVASLMHVRVGPTTVHLLFNGLLGVMLGRRACLAIPIGLFLQAALFGHGGFWTLGVNSCVLGVPALVSGGLFGVLQRVPWVRRPWFRGALVSLSIFAWSLALVYSLAMLAGNSSRDWANRVTFHPLTLACLSAVAVLAAGLERRIEIAPEFPLGLLTGTMAVLLTVSANCLVLLWGGQEDWQTFALLTFVAHLPIAVIEGVVLGFLVGFLARVRPEMLGASHATDLMFSRDASAKRTPLARRG